MGRPSSDDKISRLLTPALYERKKTWNGQVQNKSTLFENEKWGCRVPKGQEDHTKAVMS